MTEVSNCCGEYYPGFASPGLNTEGNAGIYSLRDARISDRKCEMARVYLAETLPKMQAKAAILQAVDPAGIRARNILLEGPAC